MDRTVALSRDVQSLESNLGVIPRGLWGTGWRGGRRPGALMLRREAHIRYQPGFNF